jgi:hypothetical protein
MPSAKNCTQCIAETANNTQCLRFVSCEIGCKTLCWQHVREFGGIVDEKTKACQEPVFETCSGGRYPCQDAATKTLIWNQDDEKQTYLSQGTSFKRHEKPQYLQKFNLEWKQEKGKTRNFQAMIRTTKNESKSFDNSKRLTNFSPHNPLATPKKSSMKDFKIDKT